VSIVAALSVPYWLDSPAPRYAPLTKDEEVDVVVVGGGVSGLSCALVLAEAGLRVRLLEARTVGSGASGRNGGFIVRGLAQPYSVLPEPELWRLTEQGVERVAELAGDAFRPAGHLHLFTEEEREAVLAERDSLAAGGFEVDRLDAKELPQALRERFAGGLFQSRDGVIEPGRWARGFAERAAAAGVAIAEETRVVALEETRVETERGVVTAERVVLATDGYTHGLVPELDETIEAARNQVVATAPLPERYFEPAVSARQGLSYWQQTRDNRLVIGGWRDAALEEEFTREEAITPPVQEGIEGFLATILGEIPEITHRWAGLIGFTPDRLPLAGELPARPGVWTALGYSGHGNVLALVCGEGVAHALLGAADPRLEAFSPRRIPALRAPV
jgi:glycine/D-amino acid oxidase-like deaminating enzyme